MGLLNETKSFGQGASNAAAMNVAGPIDGIAWILRRIGMPIPDDPVMGSEWLKRHGVIVEPQSRPAGLLGEVTGAMMPVVVPMHAASIAKGLLR